MSEPLPFEITDQTFKSGYSGHPAETPFTTAQVMLFEINSSLKKTNELLELILTALDEKKIVGEKVQVKQKIMNIQYLIYEDMKQHGGGTTAEIAKRMGMPENSIGPGLYRLWHKEKVTMERVPRAHGLPVSYYRIK